MDMPYLNVEMLNRALSRRPHRDNRSHGLRYGPDGDRVDTAGPTIM
jgi:hypothetical protein